jgi:hypothetical protein
MVKIIESILSDSDIVFYNDFINSAEVNYSSIGDNNYYNRFIMGDGVGRDIIIEKLISNNILNDDLTIAQIWVNKITSDTNKNDVFHRDSEDLTIIIYLNDNFTGGELEYKDDVTIHKVDPKKGLTLRLDNKVQHRVLPVTNGIRYSLVIFIKKKKALL